MQNDGWYGSIGYVFGVIAFFVSWIYCIATYGFLFGLGLGWLPSLFVAGVVGSLWPLIVVGIVVLALILFR